MANMGYCRFRNTAADLKDCLDNMDEDDRSEAEGKARLRIIDLAVRIADEYAHELGHEVTVEWAELAA